MPSTPKGVKKLARLRVRRKGTGSGRSRAPVPSYCGRGHKHIGTGAKE